MKVTRDGCLQKVRKKESVKGDTDGFSNGCHENYDSGCRKEMSDYAEVLSFMN